MRDVRSLIEESGMGSEAVMLVPEVTEEVEAIADRMIAPEAGYAFALWEVAQAMHEAAERIEVEMLTRIAHGWMPSEEVARGLGLSNLGG